VATTEDGDPPTVVRYFRKKNLQDPWNPPSRIGGPLKMKGPPKPMCLLPLAGSGEGNGFAGIISQASANRCSSLRKVRRVAQSRRDEFQNHLITSRRQLPRRSPTVVLKPLAPRSILLARHKSHSPVHQQICIDSPLDRAGEMHPMSAKSEVLRVTVSVREDLDQL
jgi:hypothetical protein